MARTLLVADDAAIIRVKIKEAALQCRMDDCRRSPQRQRGGRPLYRVPSHGCDCRSRHARVRRHICLREIMAQDPSAR